MRARKWIVAGVAAVAVVVGTPLMAVALGGNDPVPAGEVPGHPTSRPLPTEIPGHPTSQMPPTEPSHPVNVPAPAVPAES